MSGYLGCKICISEKRTDPCEIRATGQVNFFLGSGCAMKCRHHGVDLEYIERKLSGEDIRK